MRLAFIFLFDTAGHRSTVRYLEAEMIASRAGGMLRLFYLKMCSQNPFEYKDILYELKEGERGKCFYELHDRQYNFRYESDLEDCFKHIAAACAQDTQFFFCSSGHGCGFGMGSVQYTPVHTYKRTLPLSDRVINTDSTGGYTPMIWSIGLARALKQVQPAVLLFNNCYVNYLDSLYFFSTHSSYIISSQNYLHTGMLPLRELIDYMAQQNSEADCTTMATGLYEIARTGFFNGAKAPGMKGASLFLLNLSKLPALMCQVNLLSASLIHAMADKAAWHQPLLKELRTYYLTEYDLVDLQLLLRRLYGCLPAGHPALGIIDSMLQLLQSVTVRQSIIAGTGSFVTQGVSVYMPRGRKQFFSRVFLDYRNRFDAAECNIGWYQLLDDLHLQHK